MILLQKAHLQEKAANNADTRAHSNVNVNDVYVLTHDTLNWFDMPPETFLYTESLSQLLPALSI